MSDSKFEDLEIYQLAEKLSDLIWNVVVKWDSFSRNSVGIQYVEASDSIGANISEGYGRRSFADRSRFAKISRGSLFETMHRTKKSKRRKLLTDLELKEIFEITDVLLPKLSSYINYLDEKSRKKKSN